MCLGPRWRQLLAEKLPNTEGLRELQGLVGCRAGETLTSIDLLKQEESSAVGTDRWSPCGLSPITFDHVSRKVCSHLHRA